MCGRAVLTTRVDSIAEIFDVQAIEIGPPRYNLAPTQPLVTVRKEAEAAARALHLVRWGLIPWWAKPDEAKRIGAKCIQARSETVRKAPAFRDSWKHGRRCLVVVDGFYEWKGEGKDRAPFLAQLSGRRPFAIAGMWSSWRGPDATVESGTVLTTRAEGPIRAIHDRMPLILESSEWDTWMAGSPDDAAALLEPREVDLVITPVSKWVNNANHDDPQCLEPPAADEVEPPPPKRKRARSRKVF